MKNRYLELLHKKFKRDFIILFMIAIAGGILIGSVIGVAIISF